MRTDNSRHVIEAARRRAEQTRQRAVTALRRMDATGQRITFDAVSREAGVSRSWLYAQPTCAPRSSGSANGTLPSARRSLPSGNTPRLPRCCAALRRLPPASIAWKQTTSNSAMPSPGRSANAGPSKFSATTAADTPKKNSPKIIGPC